MRIQEIAESFEKFERVGSHTHIKGLGLRDGRAQKSGDGMVGQKEAREAAGIVVELVKKGKFAGRLILLAGPPGTGKTAIAIGMARELGRDVPFVQLSASEIYSAEMKKTEFLTEILRKAIGVRIREERKIYEGKVTKLEIKHSPHPYNPYQQIPSGAEIELKTKNEKKSFRVDQSFAMSMIQQQIEEGDVIQIDAETGRIAKLGKAEDEIKKTGNKAIDLRLAESVPLPQGKIEKEKEFVYALTLHNLDMANARAGMGSDILSLFFGGQGKEIDAEIRNAVDRQVKEWVEEGKATIIPGVLFIDETHMLDIEAYSFLNRAMESELAPIIVLATNRGIAKIRGTDGKSPHGMPLDLLDRLLIINTKPYSTEEIGEIIKIIGENQSIKIEKKAMDYLKELGARTSLRYAVQLLAPASVLSEKEESKEIKEEHIKKVEGLFADVKRSVNYVKKFEEKMLS